MVPQRRSVLISSLYAILAVVVVLCILQGLLGSKVRWAIEQRKSMAWVEALGGSVSYNDKRERDEQPPYFEQVCANLELILT